MAHFKEWILVHCKSATHRVIAHIHVLTYTRLWCYELYAIAWTRSYQLTSLRLTCTPDRKVYLRDKGRLKHFPCLLHSTLDHESVCANLHHVFIFIESKLDDVSVPVVECVCTNDILLVKCPPRLGSLSIILHSHPVRITLWLEQPPCREQLEHLP